MYKIFVIGLVGFMLVSCNKSKSVEIVETYENGEIKIRKTTKNTKENIYLYEELYQSGQVKIIGEIKDDKRFGEWRAYHENGNVWSVGEYVEGKRQGFSEVFFPGGVINMSGYYKDDRPDSLWVIYDNLGDTSQVTLYRNNEIVKSYNKSTMAPLR